MTDKDLAELSKALEEAEDIADRMDYLDVAKMPCPECGGSGSFAGGSLGNTCPSCFGARFVDQPFSKPRRRDFRGQLEGMRRELTTFIHALDSARADKNPRLPDASHLPRMADIQSIVAEMARTATNSSPMARQLARASRQLVSGEEDTEEPCGKCLACQCGDPCLENGW